MDATPRGFLKAAYARDHRKPYRRDEPFHLGAFFDVAVVIALLIAFVGYLTT